MKYIDRINNSAIQEFTLTNIDDGSDINCKLRYLPSQFCWMIDVSSGDFAVNGVIVTISPNILSQWSNVINFGIAFTSIDGFESFYIADFKSERTKMYLLSADEVQQVEDAINA